MRSHMLKYHVIVPACVFAVALLVGAPLGTAVVVGMMTGCMSMMVMMVAGSHRHERRDRDERNRSAR